MLQANVMGLVGSRECALSANALRTRKDNTHHFLASLLLSLVPRPFSIIISLLLNFPPHQEESLGTEATISVT